MLPRIDGEGGKFRRRIDYYGPSLIENNPKNKNRLDFAKKLWYNRLG